MGDIVNFLRLSFKRATTRKLLRGFLNLSIALVLAFGSSVRADDPVEIDQASGTIRVVNEDATVPELNVSIETKMLEPADVANELEKDLDTDAETIIVSSDESEVLEQAALNANTKPADRVFLLPFGKAIRQSADVAGGINDLLKKSGLYFVNTFRQDKIGVSIATFTLANEIVRWVHVSTASNFVITSNIIYSIIWSSLFLNKDTWSKVTKPIQKTYRKLFKMSEVLPTTTTAPDIAMKFLAGLTLSMILNSGRAALVGVDQLSHHVFSPMNISMPFIMGAVMTAVGFSWSEMMGSVNEAQYPRTKKIMRLVMNSRSLLISYFAASAMLMNPQHYGATPWIAVAVSGVTGLLLYTGSKRFIPIIESQTAGKCESMEKFGR